MISPTDKLRDGWWDRKEMEKKLQEQVTTLIRLTEMIPPSSVAELYAITIPNLITFMHKEITSALLSERTRLEGLLPRERETNTGAGSAQSEYRTGWNACLAEVKKIISNTDEK